MIILTGGAGFIGSNILRRLNSLGLTDILIVDNMKSADKYRNLVDKSFADYVPKQDFLEMLNAGKFDGPIEGIFHQGACTDTMEYDGDYMLRNNFDYSKAILHYALDRKIPLVYASSAAVYGHIEIAIEDEGTEAPLNIYGYSKFIFDQYVRRVTPGAASTVVGLRYFNVYGNGEAHKGRMSSMVYQFYNQVRNSGVAKLFGAVGNIGAGEQTRDFVYVEDLVNMNLHFWQARPPVQTIVNAGTGTNRSWNDLANAVIAEVGSGHIEYIPFPESLKDKYQFATRADVSKLRGLGYEREFHTLEQGVHAYLSTLESETAKFRSGVA